MQARQEQDGQRESRAVSTLVTRVLASAAAVNAVILLALLAALWSAYGLLRADSGAALGLAEVRADIENRDELVELCARMVAATGDVRWITRFDVESGQLRETVRAARREAPNADVDQALAAIEAADEDTAAIVRRALTLVANGDRAAATALLDGDPFARARARDEAAVVRLTGSARTLENAQHAAESRRLVTIFLGVVLGFALFLGFALGSMRVLRRQLERLRSAEDARDASEERFSALAQVSHDATVIMDGRGAIVFWNPAAERLLGWTSDEVLGRDLHDLIAPPELAARFRAMRDEFADSGSGELVGKTLENDARCKDGSTVAVEMSLAATRVGAGWHAIAVLRDVTERRRRQAELSLENRQLAALTGELAEQRERALAASRAKDDFLAHMSHELRTPLNGILGMTQLLLDTPLAGEQREYAALVHSSAENLLGILNDILDYSKMDSGRLALVDAPFEPQRLAEEVVALFTPYADEKGVDVACLVDPAVPRTLVGDTGRVRQLLLKLMSNAVKFTSRGEVVLSLGAAPRDGATALLTIEVRDTGIGIPPEKMATLFDEFTQGDSSNTRRYGGAGLGLAITRRLVAAMAGTIDVTSAPGAGSTFHCTIPLALAPAAGDAPRPLPAARALVVCERGASRRALATRLAAWGLVPTDVDPDGMVSAAQAAAAAGTPFALCVVDCGPRADAARELALALRQSGGTGAPRVIVVESPRFALGPPQPARGVDAVVARPARAASLHEAALALLTRPALPDTPARGQELTAEGPGRRRVLVVEDQPVNQRVAAKMLERFECDVRLAPNGRVALELLGRERFDLVLMDCQMPEMDGLEATRRWRAIEGERGGHLPIVAMTAHAFESDRLQCESAGMDDFVSKPVAAHTLRAAIERWAPREALLPA